VATVSAGNNTAIAAGPNRPVASVSAGCRSNSSWSPVCLQELYEIPSTPAKPAANVLGVSGFINDFATTTTSKYCVLRLIPWPTLIVKTIPPGHQSQHDLQSHFH
jgi:hypothetical protein